MASQLLTQDSTGLTFRLATPRDVDFVADRLRDADRREIEAGTTEDPKEYLRYMAQDPDRLGQTYAVVRDGLPIGLFGCPPWPNNPVVGCPWMVGTDALMEDPKELIRESRRHLASFVGQYRVLLNYVYSENTAHITYLRHLGFTVDPARPWGLLGLPFHPFYLCV